MKKKPSIAPAGPPKGPSVFGLLGAYRNLIFLLLFFALLSNGVNLLLPKIIANGIDAYPGHYSWMSVMCKFLVAACIIFVFTFLQGLLQTNVSEKVAKDIRSKLAGKISLQSFAYIEEANPSKLLTNLTGDVDAIKMFVSQAIVSIASSIASQS